MDGGDPLSSLISGLAAVRLVAVSFLSGPFSRLIKIWG